MIRIHLPDAEARRLEGLFQATTDGTLRDRLQIVLMAHRGRPARTSPPTWASTARPVTRWLNAYLRRRPRRLAAPARPRGPSPSDPRRPGRRGPPLGHRRAGQAGAGPGQLDPRGTGRPPATRPTASGPPAVGRAALLPQDRHPPVPADLPLPARRPGQAEPRPRRTSGRPGKRAAAGELVLLSQDEARFPMVPTLAATLGVKGHRPMVGTRDCKDLLYVFAVVNLLSAAVHATRWRAPRTPRSEDRQEQDPADAGGVRRPPAARRPGCTRRQQHPRVVLLIDNAPWHRGQADRRGAGGEPAPGVQAAAQLQPAAEPDRAVLEEAAAAGDAQPAVRHAGRPEGSRSGPASATSRPCGGGSRRCWIAAPKNGRNQPDRE